MDKTRVFLFQLAKDLGYKTVSELENTMTYREYIEWIDYYRENPPMSRIMESQLATLTYTMLRSYSNNSDVFPVDFMVSVSEEEKEKNKKLQKQRELFKKLDDF